MRIVVAGATGTLGGHVADAVRTAGHDPVSVSRRSGTDLLSGEGLADLLRDASAVIDASSTSSISTKGSVRFFSTVTRNLLAAERTAGVLHHVGVSIIGAAKVPAYYYAGKAAQENILMAGQGGWSLLRTTQFHEFAAQLAGRGKVGPLQIVPSMRSQPIAAAEVAAELVGIALGEPRGLGPDLAGPREESMTDMVRRCLAAARQRRPVVGVQMPGTWGRGMRDGSILPGPDARLGSQTFEEWLAGLQGSATRG